MMRRGGRALLLHGTNVVTIFVFAKVTGQPPKKGTQVLAMLTGFADDHGTWSMKEVVPEGDKATLIIHDWGAAIGLMYLRRESALKRVDRLGLMDIGPKSPPKAMALLYQLYLALASLVSRCTLNIFGNEAASNVQAHHDVLCASMLSFSATNDVLHDVLHDDMTL